MTTEPAAGRPWLLFRVDGDMAAGVDARALGQLLQDIAGAARAIADERLGLGARRGPMTALEQSLAGMRVASVSPGSVTIEFAEPPPAAIGRQSVLRLDEEVTPAAITRALVEEIGMLASDAPPGPRGLGRRRAVERIARSAARIGDSAEVVHYSPDGEEVRARVWPAYGPSSQYVPEPEIRQRVMFGHVYMADVEAGRQRLRLKLADDSNVTMSVEEPLLGELPSVLGQLAELHVSEAIVGESVVERVVGLVRLLEPEERGVELPEKPIDELAREQGLLLRPSPDYFALLSDLWETEEEAEAFRQEIREGRAG